MTRLVAWALYDERGTKLREGCADSELLPASIPPLAAGQTVILTTPPLVGIGWRWRAYDPETGTSLGHGAEQDEQPVGARIVWDDPTPAEVPAPEPEAPERGNTLDARIERLERLMDGPARHVTIAAENPRQAISALEEWTRPESWNIAGDAGEQKRTRELLAHLHFLIERAGRGDHVPTPAEWK